MIHRLTIQALFLWISGYWRWVSLLIAIVITILSLYPAASLPAVPGGDKLHHFVAYAALVYPIALKQPKHWLWLMIAVFVFSGLIEYLQPFVNRYGEWRDLVANGLGIIIGVSLGMLSKKLFINQSRNK